ncbi:MAG: HAD family phosphatase [Candidatus Diapherotrites archaeon]|uniref:HAD family phosphatase n=1 Tax=Candidatus Iainarchaeum sp. TaxID=3101447 RepID=A0A938YW42_9ARCH|nr:HAD family phosphatase [Candidatus Diapherotrites archaeon]
MKQKIKAIIFDLDGVIVDSAECEFNAYQKALGEQGIRISLKDFSNARGGTSIELLQNISKAKHIKFDTEKALKRKNNIYKKSLHKIRPYKGVAKFIRRIKGCKLAVASSGSIETIKPILKNLRILNAFDVITGAEHIKNGKPDPEIFLLTAEKLKVNPAGCLVFEDSKEGIKAAGAAGMNVIEISPKEELE